MQEIIRKWKEKCLNAIYPRCCPLCHKILEDQGGLICRACAEKQKPVSGARCMRCSKPVDSEEEYCRECSEGKHSFEQGKGIYAYDSRMRSSLVRFKYYGRRQYGEFYARAMCVYGKKEIERWKPDLMIPVPMYWRKKRIRGFNQAEDLAEKISACYGIPAVSNLVYKRKETRSQKKLNAEERRRNLKHAFVCRKNLEGLKILVIDDVYTTGSTIDAMASCLKEKGASKVYFLTLCIGRR